MSTKIYTGFKFKTMDFMQIHREIMRLRKDMNEVAVKKYLMFCAIVACERVDSHTFDLDKNANLKDAPLWVAWHEIEERQRKIKNTMERDPVVDYSFNLSILPLPDKILGIYFGENKDLIKLFEKSPLYEEYHYQNQCDCPKNISVKEWKQREKDWNVALPGVGIPSDNGFSADIVPIQLHTVPCAKEVLPFLPSFESRARGITEHLLCKEKVKIGEKDELCEMSKKLFVFREWLKKDEGKKSFQKKIKEVKAKLIRHINKDHLLTKFVEK